MKNIIKGFLLGIIFVSLVGFTVDQNSDWLKVAKEYVSYQRYEYVGKVNGSPMSDPHGISYTITYDKLEGKLIKVH